MRWVTWAFIAVVAHVACRGADSIGSIAVYTPSATEASLNTDA